jgi:SAM-dependent methyltransferase
MNTHDLIFILLMSIPIGLIVYCVYYDFYGRKLGVPTAYSSRRMRRAILAEIISVFPDKKPLRIYDPGCGNGKLCRFIARRLPHAQVIGVELSPLPYLRGRIHTFLFGPRNFEIRMQSYFDCNYSDADAVMIFLLEKPLAALEPKLKAELKPGTLVMCNLSPLPPSWQPYKNEIVENFLQKRLYCYRVS